MKLTDLLDNVVDTCMGVNNFDSALKGNTAEVIITDTGEPQSIFRLRLNSSSYSDNVIEDLSTNHLTLMVFNYVNINDRLSNVIITFETKGTNIIATAKLISDSTMI